MLPETALIFLAIFALMFLYGLFAHVDSDFAGGLSFYGFAGSTIFATAYFVPAAIGVFLILWCVISISLCLWLIVAN